MLALSGPTTVSGAVCLLLIIGVLSRRHKQAHVPLMVVAFLIDLALVLYLELTRGVVESVPGRTPTLLLVVHIAISVAVLVLYVGQIKTGIGNIRGRKSPWHLKAGLLLVVLRLVNLGTGQAVVETTAVSDAVTGTPPAAAEPGD